MSQGKIHGGSLNHKELVSAFFHLWFQLLDHCMQLLIGLFEKNLNVFEFCRQIAKHLFLPPVKLHCSMLAEDAIKAAVKDYQKKQAEANGETFKA